MLETSSREPETLEQSRGSQTERRIGLAGIFECRIEFGSLRARVGRDQLSGFGPVSSSVA